MQMMEDDLGTRWGWHHTLAMTGSGVVALAGGTFIQLFAEFPFSHGSGFGYGLVMFVFGPPLGLLLDGGGWLRRVIRAKRQGRGPVPSAVPLLSDRTSRPRG